VETDEKKVQMIKIKILTKYLQSTDNELVSKNILPMVFCLATWAVAISFLLCNMEMGIATTTTFLLFTIQLISSITDLYSRIIPLKMMIFSLILGVLIFGIFYKPNTLINHILGGVTAFAVMNLLILISKKQVGGGDLSLMTVTGFFTGINIFFSILFVSIILTGMFSLFLVLAKKRSRKTEIPFAPFILLGTVILLLSGMK